MATAIWNIHVTLDAAGLPAGLSVMESARRLPS
jgi:hypothetical protein